MNSTTLPIGVVIPTLNCAGALPDHLAGLRAWADRVEELVVVDSQSTDGTFELLRDQLKHPQVRLFQRPKGLYQAWNYGISQVRAKFAYISTVGDSITGEGLAELAAVLDATGADLVVSRPEFYEGGRRLDSAQPWPIHRLLKACPLDRARVLEPWQAFLLSIVDVPETLMGSSASNLYRTATFQRFPFPTEFGHAGDSAWGLRHCLDTRLAISPGICSKFVIHENANTGMGNDTFRELMDRFYGLAQQTSAQAAEDEGMVRASPKLAQAMCDRLGSRNQLWQLQREYERQKRAAGAWFLSPGCWKARTARNQHREALRQSTQRLVDHLGWLGQEGTGDFEGRFRQYLTRRILVIG